METKIKLVITFFLISMSTSTLNAQKKLISNKEEVIKMAISKIEQSMKDGELLKYSQKHQITGRYTFEITIRNKGEVVSISVIKNENGNIQSQNMIKDFIKEMKMGFKMPKNKNYKFSYQFNFNH